MSEHRYKRNVLNETDYVYVIAFDPGGITGYTVMGIHKDHLLSREGDLSGEIGFIDYGEIDSRGTSGGTYEELRGHAGLGTRGENEAADAMLDICNTYPGACIILEDFVLDPKLANSGRDLLSPVRLIAKLTFGLIYVHDNPEAAERVFIQNRSPVKTTCTDDRLRSWGLFESHARDHIRDSTRHAFYFLRECKTGSKAAEKRWLAWPNVFPDPIAQLTKKKSARPAKLNAPIPGLG